VGQVFSPVLDIARDPRWGRTEETYGEDPYLVSRMGVAAITGLQGDEFLIDRHHVMATAKHFAVHGQPEGGTNTAPGNYSERIIRENFLVPFQAAVQEAHVGSVMASYNEIDGIPSHINHWLLDRVLRQEWGFAATSLPMATAPDAGANPPRGRQHAEAARLALAAGVDFDLSDGSVYRTFIDQVKEGAVPESEVDRAAGRLLAAKFRLGLFEDPYVDPDYTEKITSGRSIASWPSKAAQKSRRAAEERKEPAAARSGQAQDHRRHRPQRRRRPRGRIQPRTGTRRQHSGWHSRARRLLGQAWFMPKAARSPPPSRAGAAGMRTTSSWPTRRRRWKRSPPRSELARKADVAILVVGENESTNREAWSENHLGDRDSLDLLGAQNDLVKAVVETGTPTVVLLINGRPLSINYIAEHVPAIFEGWYLGQEGGTGAANVLFGDVNPGGKLPITFPHSVGDLPDFYNHKPSDNRTYEFSTRKPLFRSATA
jgi:beta-glucosidase